MPDCSQQQAAYETAQAAYEVAQATANVAAATRNVALMEWIMCEMGGGGGAAAGLSEDREPDVYVDVSTRAALLAAVKQHCAESRAAAGVASSVCQSASANPLVEQLLAIGKAIRQQAGPLEADEDCDRGN